MKTLMALMIGAIVTLLNGCATVKMTSSDGTTIQGASVFKEINASRKGTDKSGNPYEESYKSEVAGEELGNAVGAAGKAFVK